MAAPAPAGDPFKDLFYFLGIILGIMLLWYFMGGRNSPGANSGPFLKSPIDKQAEVSTKNVSDNKNKIALSAPHDGRKSEAQKEYITIEALSSNTEKINITGWSLANKQKETATIGQAVDLPKLDQQNSFSNIYLSPGEKVYINTGFSPLGASFRVNKCSGYFGQQLPFSPALAKECPNPAKGDALPSSLDNACINFLLKNFEVCESSPSVPSTLTGECTRFILEKLNYTGCVNNNQNNSDFYKKEWRIFLNRNAEMWSDESETITLKDSKGRLVDSVSF